MAAVAAIRIKNEGNTFLDARFCPSVITEAAPDPPVGLPSR